MTWAEFDRASGTRLRHEALHVVTVTHNSASTLSAYFAGLHTCADEIAAVTIVDNASTDDTVARARAESEKSPLTVEVIQSANVGFAGGYLAASASEVGRGVPVLALNPDVALERGTAAALLDVLNSFPAAGVVTAPLIVSSGVADTASRRRLPTLSGSVVYSLLGRLTPKRLRYNSRAADDMPSGVSESGLRVSQLEATTGALMLVAPDFRTLDEGLFDTDYWMYGEDLQLCADARTEGRVVLMAETAASVHVKGVSSGRPRSRRSNRAFHEAMTIYAQKNLVHGRIKLAVVSGGIAAHFLLSEASALPVRLRAKRRRHSSTTVERAVGAR